MRSAVIIDAVRTPVGRAHPEKGIYRDVRADDLSADIMNAAVARVGIMPSLIEDIQWGCVKQEGEQGFDIARMAAVIAGLPIEVAGVTVNRNCGSGLQAVNQASQSILAQCEDVHIVGGVEHMHHIPMEYGLVPSDRLYYRNARAVISMGLTAENLAHKYKISHREQDEFALRSHQRAAAAHDKGEFGREIIPTWGRDDEGRRVLITQDQCVRRDTTVEALGSLRPAFMPQGGTVTAGNSSPNSVGAAAMIMMSDDKAKELGFKPKLRVRGMAVAGVDPAVMGIGPVPATLKALDRAGLKIVDLDLIEINEAFAAQTLAVIKELKLDQEKVNVRGGAIAIGHPLGASGARITATLLNAMIDRQATFGLVTMCIGAGQGLATVFERVA